MTASLIPSSSADHNLLFGVLALQLDFITRDQFATGMNAWALRKDQPLGAVLREQNALDPEHHDLLAALVSGHLKKHGDDARRSLAALSTPSFALKELRELLDPQAQATLDFYPTLSYDSSQETAGGAQAEASSGSSRFRILRPHARGGLGEVFVAEDQELHREVALKEIREEHAHDRHSHARFLLEAEITGGLEHPGIVPVYGLGHYADGRPYYAMRFIKGDNLKEAIGRFHVALSLRERKATETHAPNAPTEATSRLPLAEREGYYSLAFRRLLGRFIDVCNAVAYAHSRGVLHRDLKPGNIMLGKYGETLVVDWGLAKAGLRSPHAPREESDNPGNLDEHPLRPTLAEDLAATRIGSAIGTLPFMSPEQAAGRLDQLGPASDICSLGATLYVLLTGKVAYTDKDTDALLHKVRTGDFPRPRQVKPDVPAPLEAICQKAMALRPQDRYATALDLAADIEHWLADEPVSAWPEPWTVKTGRWARKHKPQVSAAAVALVALTFGAFWYQHVENRRATDEALRQAELDTRKKQVNRMVLAAVEEGETLLEDLRARIEDPMKVHVLLSRIQDWKAIVDKAEQTEKRARAVTAGQEDLLEAETDARLRLFAELVKAEDKSYWIAKELDDIRLEAAIPEDGKLKLWAAIPKFAALFGRLAIDVPQGEASQVADSVARSPVRHALIAALDHWAFASNTVGTRFREHLPRVLRIARLADPDPWRDQFRNSTIWYNSAELKKLASSLDLSRQSPQIAVSFALCLHSQGEDAIPFLRTALLVHPADFWLHFTIAGKLKEPGEQTAHLLAALAIRPESNLAYSNLGNALHSQKKWSEARVAYQMAIKLNSNDAHVYNGLGNAFLEEKRVPEAIATYFKCIQIDPTHALAYKNLGVAFHTQNKLPEAIDAYHKAIEIDRDYAKAYQCLGVAFYDQKKLTEAIAAFARAIELDPNDPLVRTCLGNALRAQNKLPDALAAHRKALELDPKCVPAYYNLGNALRAQNMLPEAIAAYEMAIKVEPTCSSYINLGVALAERQMFSDAIVAFRNAIKLDPVDALAYMNLGKTLRDQKKLSAAIPAFQKAIELNPKLGVAHFNLGLALHVQNMHPEAIAALKKAIDLNPRDAEAYNSLGCVLVDQKRFPEAIAAYRTAISLDSKFAPAYLNLGNAFLRQKRLAEAIAAFHDAIHLDPKDVTTYVNLAAALRDHKKPLESIAVYRRAIKLDPKVPNGHLGMAFALSDLGSFADAVKASKGALELLPTGHPLRGLAQRHLQNSIYLLTLENRLTLVLNGQESAEEAALLELANIYRGQKGRHATAVRLFELAFRGQPTLAIDLTTPRRYNAACSAALAGTYVVPPSSGAEKEPAKGGTTNELAKLTVEEKAKFRRQALDWLQADLGATSKQLTERNSASAMLVEQRLSHWQQDPDLAGVREPKALAKLPGDEQQAWQKLWSDVQQLLKSAQNRFIETRHQGSLTDKAIAQVHEFKMVGGTTYLIDLESKDFDTLLKLEAANGTKLAENDDRPSPPAPLPRGERGETTRTHGSSSNRLATTSIASSPRRSSSAAPAATRYGSVSLSSSMLPPKIPDKTTPPAAVLFRT